MTSSPFRYNVGGCLQADEPNYVIRQADIDIYNALNNQEFCYVFSSRQMGKSSLLVRVKSRLQQNGARCAYIDLTRLGNDGLKLEQWYAGMAVTLLQSLNLWHQVNFPQWWQARQDLTLLQRLNDLVEEILLATENTNPLYIFIDEIDSLLSLKFATDDFFAWMRSCYNQRAHDRRYSRLTFALFGVATPTDLIADKQRTPFNIGQAIRLDGFTLEESAPLLPGLKNLVNCPEAVLKAILAWTGGQPFLTQKLCQLAVQTAQKSQKLPLELTPAMADIWVENLVRSRLIDHWETQDEPVHLRTIRDHLFWYEKRTARLLGIYQQLLAQTTVYSDDSREQIDLILSGLVIRQGNQLTIKNQIYSQVFTPIWVKNQLHYLRPYATAFEAWLESEQQDTTYLLQGQTLLEIEQWARDKSLTDLDYQFLAASQDREKKRIQEALDAKQESERFFRQLAQAIPQIVWILERDGTVSYSNQQGINFSGLFPGNGNLVNRLDIIHPDDHAQSTATWLNSLETGEPYAVQVRMRDAQGNYRWFLNRAIPIYDAQGKVVKWFGTSTDLEEVKREEEQKRLKEVEARLIEQEKRLQQEQRAKRLQRWLLGSVSVALVISSSFGILAVSQKRQSDLREVEAITNASEAQFASGNRLDALVTAIKAYNRLQQLWQPSPQLINQVEQDLKRATFRAIERDRLDSGQGVILGMALSPDGRMASAHVHGTIVLWDAKGKLLKVLKGHQQEVLEVAFSPDGKILVSTGKDGTLRLWTAEGDAIATIPAHQNRGMAVAISPDGRWIATGSEDNTVKLWNIQGKLVKTFKGHQNFVWDIAFSPDSQTLASASWDNTVILWNLEGKPLKTLSNPRTSDKGENRLVSVAFSPDGQTLVAGDWYGTIIWWNLKKGTLLRATAEHHNAIVSLAFSPDGQTLASGSWDNTIKCWNLDGSMIKEFSGHPTGTWEVIFTPDSQKLISAGGDGLIRIWQLQPNSLTILRGHRASIWGVAVAPNGQIFSSSSDGTIKHWDTKGQLLHTLTSDGGEVWSVAVNPQGNGIVGANNDASLSFWSLNGVFQRKIQAHQDVIFDVTFNPDGTEIATASWDGSLKLWHNDGKLSQILLKNRQRLNAVAFSPDNQWIATVGEDQKLRIWKRNAKGKFASQPHFEIKAHEDTILDVAFSPDSQIIATASEDTTIKLWNLEGKLINTLKGHKDRVNGITFIPKNSGLPDNWGTVLVSASWDNSIKLWQLDGTLLDTLEGHEERVLNLAFYPKTPNNSAFLVSVGLDDVAILWQLNHILDIKQVLNYGCEWIQDYAETELNDQDMSQKLCNSL